MPDSATGTTPQSCPRQQILWTPKFPLNRFEAAAVNSLLIRILPLAGACHAARNCHLREGSVYLRLAIQRPFDPELLTILTVHVYSYRGTRVSWSKSLPQNSSCSTSSSTLLPVSITKARGDRCMFRTHTAAPCATISDQSSSVLTVAAVVPIA